jgi:hypothetical protein
MNAGNAAHTANSKALNATRFALPRLVANILHDAPNLPETSRPRTRQLLEKTRSASGHEAGRKRAQARRRGTAVNQSSDVVALAGAPLATGASTDIINELARNENLRVLARDSSFALSHKKIYTACNRQRLQIRYLCRPGEPKQVPLALVCGASNACSRPAGVVPLSASMCSGSHMRSERSAW